MSRGAESSTEVAADGRRKLAGAHEQALSVERAVSEARKATNLSNFGSDDFLSGLRSLLDSTRHQADLNLAGAKRLELLCCRLLRNRLQIEAAFGQYPEISHTRIVRPLIVVGLYRSGTTFLHHMLSKDPQAHAPLMWELSAPAPPPALGNRSNDPRIKGAEQAVLNHRSTRPEIDNIHPLSATNPEECSLLLQNSFTSAFFFLNLNVPHYLEWLLGRDMQDAYRYYFRQLQILFWRSPAQHMVLKAPEHLLFLDALLAVLPNACIVHLHRDPTDLVASSCSLMASLRSLWVDDVDRAEIGRQTVDLLALMGTRSIAARRAAEPRRFYDVHYGSLLEQPLRTVREIYEYFGYDYTTGFDTRLAEFIAGNHQNRESSHVYSLEKFGLTGRVVGRFAEYMISFPAGDR